MSKEVKFFITEFRNFYKVVNQPIRNKEDIIRILLLSIKNLLLENKFDDEDKGEININVVKSSRIYFFCKRPGLLPDKYYSFVFPFFLDKDTEDRLIVRCKTSSEIINSELIDFLIVLLENGWFSDSNINSDDIDKFACDYLDVVEEYYDIKSIFSDQKDSIDIEHWSIIKNLLTFEPSYVRYDYDPKHVDGEIHPLNHLDIHYTTSGTFKLGFDRSINIKDRLGFDIFKDILDNGKARGDLCYKLK